MNKRYNESSIAIGSGVELGHDENMDETIVRDIDGDLRVGHAELSLGQRLATVVDAGAHRSSDSEDGGDNPTKISVGEKEIKGRASCCSCEFSYENSNSSSTFRRYETHRDLSGTLQC